MSVQQIPAAAQRPFTSVVFTSSVASWSVPSGITKITASIVAGDGGASYTEGWPPYFVVGATGGNSAVTVGSTTYTAIGGLGARWAGPGYNLSYTISSGPWSGQRIEVVMSVVGITSLAITVGSGGGFVVLSY